MAIFMQYEGMTGSASEKNHKDWIECSSISFSAFREAQTALGQGGNRQGKNVSIGDITITKRMCAASPHLFTASVLGGGKKVKLHVTRSSATGQTNYLEVALEHCCVTNYAVNSDGASHTEVLTLNFLTLEMKYIPVKQDGSAGTPMPVHFNVGTGSTAAA
jgi:type VI secretion system secreted protein Hcp